MASPNSSWTELITSTLEKRQRVATDNMKKNVPLFDFLNKKGNVQTFSGGRTIIREIEYAANSTVMNYSGYELLDPTPQDILTAAEFSIKQKAVAITMSGLEKLQNAGKEQIINLAAVRYKNAEKSMINSLGGDCFSDGTGSDGKQLTGLQSAIADTSTGTYGGISRSTYTWWKNISKSASTDFGAGIDASNILDYINRCQILSTRDGDLTDVIFADNTYYQHAWNAVNAITRLQSENDSGKVGYRYIIVNGVKLVLANGSNNNCPSLHMYGLNTDYIYLMAHSDCNMTKLGKERLPERQDASITYMGWAGNLVCSNSSLQWVLTA